MSFRKFRRKLGWRSSKDDAPSQSKDHFRHEQQQPDFQDAGTASGKTSFNVPTDSSNPSIPEAPSLPDQPSQVHPKEGATEEDGPTRKGSDEHIRELWDVAYEALREEDERLIQDFEERIEGDLGAGLSKAAGSRVAKRDWMNTVLTRKMSQVNRDSWKLKFGGSEVLVKDMVKPVLGVVSWANDFISKAVSANASASLAWSGVSLLLPAASLAQGLEYISSLIVQSYLWEDLYERYSKSEAGGPSHITYCYYARSTAYRLGLDSVKWHEWEELLEKIKEQDRVFSAVLNGCRDVRYDEECSAAEQRHEQVMSCWQAIGTDVSGLLSAVREAQRQKERKELLQWLCEVDTSELYNAARDKHQTGTCSWLIEDSEDFKTWMKSPKSLLWLNEKPGSGKSILSSSVIKHLQDKCKSDPGTALAYFYFNFGSLEQQSVAIMLSSLVKQMCASRPDTPQAIKNFEDYKTKGERPDTKTLEEAFIASTRGFSDVFIVVDALDECPMLNGERGKLLASITRIAAAMPENLHLFCTSRAEPDISTAINKLLYSLSGTEINLLKDTAGLDSDMSTYINSVLESDDYRSWPAELKDDARRLLIEKADGMFQYIVCQFEGLRNLRSRSLISSALENLPKGLDATYDRLLLSLEPEFEAQIVSSLKWLAFSNRPLRLQELAEIFILQPERAVGFDEAERLFETEEVLRYISSLVTVHKVKNTFKRTRVVATYVRLAHFTIKEYMISSRIGKGPAARFSFTENDAHLHISHCCLVYHLYETDASCQDGYFPFPLGSYATKNWVWHLEMAPRHKWSFEIVRLAARALAVHSRSLRKILRIGIRDRTSPLYGFLNLTDLLFSAASDTYDYLTLEDLNLTLLEATLVGSLGIVQLVLDKGAHVDARNDKGESALQLAASRNHQEIVNLLLSCGADTFKSGCALTSTLSSLCTVLPYMYNEDMTLVQSPNWMTSADYKRCLQLLIDNGADISKQCAIHGTALSMAASKMGDHKTRYFVDFLLQRGADVNLSGGVFGYPLQAACSHRISDSSFDQDSCVSYDAVVMTLLEMGAEVNAQGGRYGNALQAASYAGNYAVVTMEPHCKQHAQLNIGKSRICCWIEVQKLMSKEACMGAEVNKQGGKYGTAVQGACARGEIGVVRLLVAHGCDVNIKGGKYGTALQAACASKGSRTGDPNTELVGLLIEHGADVHVQGGEFGSAWHAAATQIASRAYDTLKMLLDHGVNVNDSKGRLHGTALQAAIELLPKPSEAIDRVRFLIEHGADINAGGGPYGFPLQSACKTTYRKRFNSSQVSFYLLDNCPDIDVRMTGGKFGTALQAAAFTGKIRAIKRMLGNDGDDDSDSGNDDLDWVAEKKLVKIVGGEYGSADWKAKAKLVNIRGGEYGSALDAAVYAGETDVVEALLIYGADADARGGKYGSAINAAVLKGYWDLVEILLNAGAKPDCHYLLEPDEEWLKWVEKEDGRGAVERYKKFWEKQKRDKETV
ncbi:hypothetical protein CcaCcLH18_04775 [Colletotrichum camelliae]|nr:hypothetical protein CcaCcLH18_04775 [Colletotrichum camelliae]